MLPGSLRSCFWQNTAMQEATTVRLKAWQAEECAAWRARISASFCSRSSRLRVRVASVASGLAAGPGSALFPLTLQAKLALRLAFFLEHYGTGRLPKCTTLSKMKRLFPCNTDSNFDQLHGVDCNASRGLTLTANYVVPPKNQVPSVGFGISTPSSDCPQICRIIRSCRERLNCH